MRLKQRDIDAIKAATLVAFGGSAVVRLYGSRVRYDLRGGDIDLLIEADPDARSEFERVCDFKHELFQRIDEQRVDVIVVERGREPSAFARLVASDALPLP